MNDFGRDIVEEEPHGDESLRADLKAFVDGELPAFRRSLIRWRLSRSPEWREEVSWLRRVGDRMRELDQARPDAGLRARILANLPEMESAGRPAPARRLPSKPQRRRNLLPAFGACMAVAGIAGAFVLTRNLASPPTSGARSRAVAPAITQSPVRAANQPAVNGYPIGPAPTDGTYKAAEEATERELAGRERVSKEETSNMRPDEAPTDVAMPAAPANHLAPNRAPVPTPERYAMGRAQGPAVGVPPRLSLNGSTVRPMIPKAQMASAAAPTPTVSIALDVPDVDQARRTLAEYTQSEDLRSTAVVQTSASHMVRERAFSLSTATKLGLASGAGISGRGDGTTLTAESGAGTTGTTTGTGTSGSGTKVSIGATETKDKPVAGLGGNAPAAPGAGGRYPTPATGDAGRQTPGAAKRAESPAHRLLGGAAGFGGAVSRAEQRRPPQKASDLLPAAVPATSEGSGGSAPMPPTAVEQETIMLLVPSSRLPKLMKALNGLGKSRGMSLQGGFADPRSARGGAPPPNDGAVTGSRRGLFNRKQTDGRIVRVSVTLRRAAPATTGTTTTSPR